MSVPAAMMRLDRATPRDPPSAVRGAVTHKCHASVYNKKGLRSANDAEQYCRKGSKIYLEGQLQTREYTDKDGNQRKATDVVLQKFRGELTLLDSRNSRGGEEGQSFERSAPSGGGRSGGGGGDRRPAAVGGGRSMDLDDDIPF